MDFQKFCGLLQANPDYTQNELLDYMMACGVKWNSFWQDRQPFNPYQESVVELDFSKLWMFLGDNPNIIRLVDFLSFDWDYVRHIHKDDMVALAMFLYQIMNDSSGPYVLGKTALDGAHTNKEAEDTIIEFLNANPLHFGMRFVRGY